MTYLLVIYYLIIWKSKRIIFYTIVELTMNYECVFSKRSSSLSAKLSIFLYLFFIKKKKKEVEEVPSRRRRRRKKKEERRRIFYFIFIIIAYE